MINYYCICCFRDRVGTANKACPPAGTDQVCLLVYSEGTRLWVSPCRRSRPNVRNMFQFSTRNYEKKGRIHKKSWILYRKKRQNSKYLTCGPNPLPYIPVPFPEWLQFMTFPWKRTRRPDDRVFGVRKKRVRFCFTQVDPRPDLGHAVSGFLMKPTSCTSRVFR